VVRKRVRVVDDLRGADLGRVREQAIERVIVVERPGEQPGGRVDDRDERRGWSVTTR
jgi:hypothetical protein